MRRTRPDRTARPAAPAPGGAAARQAALRLLTLVLAERRLLSDAAPVLAPLDPPDRARAQRLATDTLRGLARADALLAPLVERRPPMPVLNILRLGAVELAHGAAAHGVVNDLVGIAGRGKRTAGARGLVNAVLRRLSPDAEARWADLPAPRLPKWLRGPLVRAWGAETVAAMEAVHAMPPPLDLTARGDPAVLAHSLGGTLLPTGSVRLDGAGQVSALPGYDAGDWWVQDAAAALPVRLLDPRPGERVLDLCAAPGGKTMQLAATGAEVTALDLSDERLGRLRENLARTRLPAEVVVADALTWEGGPFDAILLDAPCSATGTIRRHPDLPFARSGEGLGDLIGLQARMIDRALALLGPGGRLVFCTCSLLPEEGEAQVRAAVERHEGVRAEPPEGAWIDARWSSPEGGLRVLPHHWAGRGGIDGFYMARLRRA
ncbi:RsmB/NOP family class I SAM-dependent RNA methyltransferase [Wenxinia marina]|uniref:tRNA and rRNA cytosine-C5-methylase n=1 Tax=Wenxinia marina DSM 24838 TaxID=1123501 RepID=A0A0D0Q8T4_9RHOB|nr:transcription antitermination factor NusB [Wenxinia marina]KIQ70814.1 tRNA and rRNA cytosine-C5-methylase [Wenxinia marina DSM 24838]GGL57073.1 16S rRNA methyltransferase [Wenxinia marina]